ncbi:MAG: hypothetical protein AAF485_31670 [Chloroflexota bacterium]
MTRYLEYELGKIADFIVNDMFQVKPKDTVVITSDSGSNFDIVDALARAVHVANGHVVVMQTPQFKGRVNLVDESIPTELYVNALSEADIWIDANAYDFLYSNTFERVLAKNKTIRYILLGDLSTDIMAKIYGGYNIAPMIAFCAHLKTIIAAGKQVAIKNAQGTDITFDLEPAHVIAIDSGEATEPGLYTSPALVNIVPRFGSVNGVVVFDALYDAYPDKIMEEPLRLTIEESRIVAAEGNRYAEKFMQILNSWEDDNACKVAHVNFGLLPTIREMVGHVVVDERVWGVLNWGFGSVSPVDAPPNGQPSNYHMDAICSNGSVWIDDIQITELGEIVHADLKVLSEQFLI